MKRLRFPSGQGNGSAIIPSGQVLDISMIPGPGGSWIQIAESAPIWVPGGGAFELGAHECGLCCGAPECDQWPGDQQIEIVFGQNVDGLDARDTLGDAPIAWFVVWNGC